MRPRTRKILLIYSVLVFMFFYIPLVVLMAFSFNDSKLGTVWTGFTFEWYVKLFNNSQIIEATVNSLIVAVITTIISTVLGVLGALVLHRYIFPGRKAISFIFYIPVVIPEIVLAVALLSLYGAMNIQLGLLTIVPGHVVFATSFVILVLLARLAGMDNALEEAAKDLGANEWHTFWKVTFPLLFPGILAGALMAFTISLDEFVVAFFTTGPGSNTLPVLVYSMVRRGVSPEINALSTILILLIIFFVSIVGWRMMRADRKGGEV
ncbi:ABC transporter permease [Alteribacillus iranensis]|uniref:Spermidine/putrescine transport system permease protein n=1 Tax=Alteribacillus iranensis TaxID=930128 RepID=A0A1I2E2I2_9BACI|nr:ABC transporter permease [Alteribacillus iranensis]SFE86761.1 spermidine/putrescine transport system permease protein [Alteribacillus iranensis]